jgi:hypothetical protein
LGLRPGNLTEIPHRDLAAGFAYAVLTTTRAGTT